MDGRILVTGGTGTLGRVLVRRLLAGGQQPRVLSRRPNPQLPGVQWVTGDLRTGPEIADAVSDVAAIVHCATNGPRPVDDVIGTRRLIEAARLAGAPHLIYVSIVGVDRIPLKYYRYKYGIEGIVERSGLPWTVQRATQFHDLVSVLLRTAAFLPVLPLPAGTSLQPIDTADVADRLLDVAAGPALGRAPDIGGPRVEPIQELARHYLEMTGKRRAVGSVRYPGKVAAGYRSGFQLTPDHADGVLTYQQFLERSGS